MAEHSMLSGVSRDLGGRMLRMATLQWPPFVMRHQNETSTWYTGLCIDVLHILSEALNFTYAITEPADSSYGQKLSNSTWIGMTGLLHSKRADFALAAMSVTQERATVSDHTSGFYFDEVVMITTRPQLLSTAMTFFFRPFHWLVFLLLGCGLVSVTALYLWFERLAGRKIKFGCTRMAEGKGDVPMVSVAEAMMTTFGMLIGRATVHKAVSTGSRTLLYFWSLLSLVIVATYTGKLTSNALVTEQQLPFRSLRELVKRKDYRWGLVKGTFVETILSNSTNEDYRLYYQGVLKFAAEDPDILTEDLYTALDKIMSGYYVHLTSGSAYDFLKKDHCQLTRVPERLFQDTLAIHLQKGSPYTRLFNDVLARATEMGILQYLKQKWFPEKADCHGDQAVTVSVSLQLVQTAFYMALAGLALAALYLGLENLIGKRYSQRQTV